MCHWSRTSRSGTVDAGATGGVALAGWGREGVTTMRVGTGRRGPQALTTGALLALALVMASLAGCGGDPQPADLPDPSTAGVAVEVFFTHPDRSLTCHDVVAVTRAVDPGDPVRGALEALLAGPTDDEFAAGYGGWFSAATDGMLVDVEVVDGTAHVVLADLREVIPNASTACGSATLLAQLDGTLLAFEHIDDTRHAFADQAAFYEWLQLDDPDAPEPVEEEPVTDDVDAATDDRTQEPDATEATTEPAAADEERPDADDDPQGPFPSVDVSGWIPAVVPGAPYSNGCCGVQTLGEVSPPWPSGPFEGAEDGYYDVDVERRPDDPAHLHLTLYRWESCVTHPELCDDEPYPGHEDLGVAVDPGSHRRLTVPIAELAVRLSHVHAGFELPELPGETSAIQGDPGAFAALLADVLDPIYDRAVLRALEEGEPATSILARLEDAASDPAFPFGVFPLVDHEYDPSMTFVAFRGPLGYPIEFVDTLLRDEERLLPPDADRAELAQRWNESRGSYHLRGLALEEPDRGLYDLRGRALEVRDGQLVLHLESGWPTWG